MGRAQKEEKAPDTMPVPTPPLESGKPHPDVTIAPRRGYVQAPTRKVKPTKHVQPTIDELLVEVEKKGGDVPPEITMFVLRAYRSLEATNRALKGKMAEHVEALKAAKAEAKVRKR